MLILSPDLIVLNLLNNGLDFLLMAFLGSLKRFASIGPMSFTLYNPATYGQ